MSSAAAVTKIWNYSTQLSIRILNEQCINLRLKLRFEAENWDEEIWWHLSLISLLNYGHEGCVNLELSPLYRNNPCQTVCYMCNVLTTLFFSTGLFKVANIISKKPASLAKVTSHPYDKVFSLSPEENPIPTGIKSMFIMMIEEGFS